VDEKHRARLQAMADREGMSLSQFLRSVLVALPDDHSPGASLQRFVDEHVTAAMAPPKVHRRRAGCERVAFHRSGVYCKTCGTTPA